MARTKFTNLDNLSLQDFEGDGFDNLCAELKKLSTECNKYRAKKDRRQQRSSFRDILNSVENGQFTKQRIRVSVRDCRVT